MALRSGLLRSILVLAVVTGCRGSRQEKVEARRQAAELSQQNHYYDLAPDGVSTPPTASRIDWLAALNRTTPVPATGALLVDLKLTQDHVQQYADDKTPLRVTCGVTMISPSYAITAGHCVDGESVKDGNTPFTLEMYRPAPGLAQKVLARRDTLKVDGPFPQFSHNLLGPADGYFTDRSDCFVVSRCFTDSTGRTDFFNCPPGTPDRADLALVRCKGFPGSGYGYLKIAAQDDPEAEVFTPWKHEVYAIPPVVKGEPLYDHYLQSLIDGEKENFHYLSDRNQLLSLISLPWPSIADGGDGPREPRRKRGDVDFNVNEVVTEVMGCHGTSGSGMLQQNGNRWELLGPAVHGLGDTGGTLLCDHDPTLDGVTVRPPSRQLTYEKLALVRRMRDEFSLQIAGDCVPPSLTRFPVAFFTFLGCQPHATVAMVRPLGRINPLDGQQDGVLVLTGNDTAAVQGYPLVAGQRYRVGLSAATSSPCDADGASCPKLAVSLGGAPVFTTALDPRDPLLPVNVAFTAPTTGNADLALTASLSLQETEVRDLTVVPEGQPNDFDDFLGRLEASVVRVADPTAVAPLRFAGDGKQGFAAVLAGGERLMLTRQAIVPRQDWSVRFTASSYAGLTCGLVDLDGTVGATVPCDRVGAFRIRDGHGGPNRAAFFIEAPAGAPAVTIDDVALASSAAPDSDGDGIADPIDHCPQDPARADVTASAPASVTVSTCRPDAVSVKLPLPTVGAGCASTAAPTITGQVVASGGIPLVTPLALSNGTVALVPGVYSVRWTVKLADGRVIATLGQEARVTLTEGAQCCASGQQVVSGTVNADSIVPQTVKPYCVLALAGDDQVVTPSKNDLLLGGPGGDFLDAGGGTDEVIGGDGGDFITGGAGGRRVADGGPRAANQVASRATSSRLVGGPDDDRLTGSPGPDELIPGPGVDAVYAGGGDDTVILYHECEIRPGKVLDGGAGKDTLVTPVPITELRRLGVTVNGFEKEVIRTDQRALSDCR